MEEVVPAGDAIHSLQMSTTNGWISSPASMEEVVNQVQCKK